MAKKDMSDSRKVEGAEKKKIGATAFRKIEGKEPKDTKKAAKPFGKKGK